MAMAGGCFRDEDEIDENYVTQLQASIRGYLMRRNLQLVREEYEQIFSEIEGSEKIFVCWPLDTLCLPKTQKVRPTKKVSHKTSVVDCHTSSPPEKNKTCLLEKLVSTVQDDNLDLSSQKENKFQEKCTAETQTSFIEDLNLKLSLGSSLLSQNTSEEERRTPVQDDMYTSSREESFTDQSGTEADSHLVQHTFDDSGPRQIHPSTSYNDKTGLPLKSPDSSEGFEHSGKNSVSRSSSGRSQVKSSGYTPERTEVTGPAVNSKRLQGDSDRSRDSSRSRDRSKVNSDRSDVGRSEVRSDRSNVRSNETVLNSGRSRVRSDRSGERSDRSEVKSDTDRSEVKSNRSDARSDKSSVSRRSDFSPHSNRRSEVSPHSDRRSEVSPHSDRRSGVSPYRDRRPEVSPHSDRRSEVSPHSDRRELDCLDREPSPASLTPRRYLRESSVLTNATSVWDSVSSATDYIPSSNPETITDDADTLMEMRKNVAMELLWVQQAINSRKNYLKIKDQMKIPVSTS